MITLYPERLSFRKLAGETTEDTLVRVVELRYRYDKHTRTRVAVVEPDEFTAMALRLNAKVESAVFCEAFTIFTARGPLLVFPAGGLSV